MRLTGLELLAAVLLGVGVSVGFPLAIRALVGIGDEMLGREDLGNVSEGTRRYFNPVTITEISGLHGRKDDDN